MNKTLTILVAGLVLVGTISPPTAQAASLNRELARAQAPGKGETCKPKWPYITLTCVA